MKKYIFVPVLLFFLGVTTYAQDININNENEPRFFLTINGTLGSHTINFKDFAKSSGLSFGFSISAGIYAVNNGDYKGGLGLTFLEGASRDTNRRQLSEDFVLPDPSFDKHIIFNFAQFRSATIGWFNQLQVSETLDLYHQIGFGIFGTTERDQLLDFGMSNQAGVLIGNQDAFRLRVGLTYDTTFGTGNPNYTQNNIGITFGGFRSF